MTLPSLPVFVRLAGRPVILVGAGEAAEAKRRLLERAGATIVGEEAEAALAIVVDDEDAVARLKARGVLVNAVDRPELCDFTLPAIVDRSPVIVAVGTGGVSAGLAAALRQRLELLLPARLGRLAERLHAARAVLRERFPQADDRRRAIGDGLRAGGPLDPLGSDPDVAGWLRNLDDQAAAALVVVRVTSADPDDLTLRQARALAQADRVYHDAAVPAAILDRARADAARIVGAAPAALPPGLSVSVEGPA
ncbi:uroporphyrin-III C-methyltransferase / precorrin-2 dehydrogenase / sirohydrochlorin ferrochelatase [Sphingomonas guangdongensis]|uniref:precorrin-2 dehydrogenase n=1 Tax=Sphingomonas guangdongensis TaxID=1141890 RepID=A0A285QDW5_9SPHN|nr:bifunctional precorrin-2 dehydrogenase/sirohydrochlorin ferrochelatase [Sphingomonas guangdongensis]SOB80130.1 uroporphyrin-III C-methyltransferase / precorrin-2 dehydrogenase / sirohydrochlorin ferrochelatase [Sphingomonas guangdongensis]